MQKACVFWHHKRAYIRVLASRRRDFVWLKSLFSEIYLIIFEKYFIQKTALKTQLFNQFLALKRRHFYVTLLHESKQKNSAKKNQKYNKFWRNFTIVLRHFTSWKWRKSLFFAIKISCFLHQKPPRIGYFLSIFMHFCGKKWE